MNPESIGTPELIAWCFASCQWERVPNDTHFLHRALARLRHEHGGNEGPLEEFIFQTSTIFPFSVLLSDILDALRFGGILYTCGYDHPDLIVCAKWRERWLPKFDPLVPEGWKEVGRLWLPRVVELWEVEHKKKYDGGSYTWQQTAEKSK